MEEPRRGPVPRAGILPSWERADHPFPVIMPLTLSKVHCLCRDCSPLSQGEGSDCLTSEGNHLPTDTVIPAGSPGPLGVRWGTEFFSGWVTCPHPPITVALTVLNKLLPKHGTQRFSADSTDPSALAVLPGLLNQNGLSFVLVAQSCSTLCDTMDCSPPGSSVHGILQARILQWVAISFSRGPSQPRNQTLVLSNFQKFKIH